MKKIWKDHLGNIYLSKKDMCQFYKISVKTFDGRINRNWDLKTALTTPQTDRTITYQGQQYDSLNCLCKAKNVSYKKARYRLSQGYNLEEALSDDFIARKNKPIEYQGVTYKTLKEFCINNKYNYKKISANLNKGYSLEESIQEKLFRKCSRNKSIIYKEKKYRSLSQLCAEYGKSYELIHSRLRQGYNIEEAMDDDLIKNSGSRTYFTYNGVNYNTIKEFCDAYGIKYQNFIAYKQNHNLSLEEAIQEYFELTKCKKQTLIYDDVEYHTRQELFDCLGISSRSVKKWEKKGYNTQDAIKKVLESKILYQGKRYDNYKQVYEVIDTDVSFRVFKDRISKGHTIEDASNPYLFVDEIVYEGISYKGLPECCRETGRNLAAVKWRLNHGASLEEAMSLNNKNEIIYKGKAYNSLSELCRIKKKNIKLVQSRMGRGWSLEKAIEKEIVKYKYKGRYYKSLVELCNSFNRSYSCVKDRLKRGCSLDEAMSPDSYENKKPVVFNEISYDSLASCCKALGLSYKFIFARISNGYTLEEALTLPKRLYIGEYRVAECLKRLNVKFYHDCPIKNIFADFGLSIDWNEFLAELQSRLGSAGYNWSKQKIQRLRPDFVLYTDEDNKIRGVIEFDGEQHQNFVEFFFKTIEEFYRRSDTDFVKQSFWEYLNIPMLRIRHDQIDMIDDMVQDFIDNPQNYIHNHNTYLSENEYWSILTEQKAQIEMAFAA